MRISGGEWGGRNLDVPKGDAVRPTQDRVREALFSMIQGELAGAAFLDLFAGSGSVGLDALSRGAARTTWVELLPKHAAVLRANIALVKAEGRGEIVVADAYRWLEGAGKGRRFDIAYADPPYALGAEKGFAKALAALAAGDVVKAGGLFIAEMKSDQAPDEVVGWELVRDRRYGQTRLAVYRRKEA